MSIGIYLGTLFIMIQYSTHFALDEPNSCALELCMRWTSVGYRWGVAGTKLSQTQPCDEL